MTYPRWQVLNEADRIVANALDGRTTDPELRRLVETLRLREIEEAAKVHARTEWEKIKLSPYFRLWRFYVALFGLSIMAGLLQKKLEKNLR